MRTTKEPKELQPFMLRKHVGYVYIVDKDWAVTIGMMFHETEENISFLDWSIYSKQNYENMLIHSYNKYDYGISWKCFDGKPTPQQIVEFGKTA